MTTAIEFLRVLPSTKQQVQLFSDKLRNELMEGEIPPLELVLLKKSLEAVFDSIKPEMNRLALDEAEKYGEKSFEVLGMKITVGENGTSYDYSACNDPVYNRLKHERDELSLKIKEREAYLKTIKSKVIIVDEETGDMCETFPPVKTSTTGLKVQLK